MAAFWSRRTDWTILDDSVNKELTTESSGLVLDREGGWLLLWQEQAPAELNMAASAAEARGRTRRSCPTSYRGNRARKAGGKILRCAQDDMNGEAAGMGMPVLQGRLRQAATEATNGFMALM